MNPKDPAQLINNFKTLASIGPGHGVKISFNTSTFMTTIVGEHLQRTDVIEAEARHQFVASKIDTTIRDIFDTAYGQMELNKAFFQSDPDLPRRAVAGAKQLVANYKALSIMGGIAGLKELPQELDDGFYFFENAPLNLSAKYADYLVVSFEQDKYLPRDNLGVCCALAVDWISRRQQVWRAKPSLAVSKKMGLDGSQNSGLTKSLGLLTTLDPTRIQRKLDTRIIPAQQAYETSTRASSQGALIALRSLGGKSAEHVSGMRGRFVADGPRKLRIDRVVKGEAGEGAAVFREILGYCVPPPSVDPMLATWKQSLAMYENKRGFEALAAMFSKKVEEAEAKSASPSPNAVNPDALTYVLAFRGAEDGGHAIALYLDKLRYTVFDPNFGEFEFPKGAEDQMYAFFSDLWGAYRNPDNQKKRMTSWALEEFYFRDD